MMRYFALLTTILFSSMACAQQTTAEQNTNLKDFAPIYVPVLPAELEFAGERVPLENYDTRESLQRELLSNIYLHSRTTQTLLATTRYFPVIEPILKRYGIPDDFKYLCMAESGLNPNAGSSAGAAGLWQLMPAFAKSVGLYSGGGVDERYHLEKSTEAACRYLLDAKARFGSWTLAAASYNVGVAGVSKRMERQGVDNYYDLFLPEETLRYVFRILTFKAITPTPDQYGFHLPAEAFQKPLTDYTEVTIEGAHIDWSKVAREKSTTYKMLRELNQWIRDYDYTSKVSRSFTLRIPNTDFRRL